MVQNWSWHDYDLVYKQYPFKGVEVKDELADRTPTSIMTKAKRLGVSTDCPLTEAERELISKYGKDLGTALIFILPERTTEEIKEALGYD